MEINNFTYHVTWSHEDNEHLGLCVEFPALSFLAKEQEEALKGILAVVLDVPRHASEWRANTGRNCRQNITQNFV